MNFRKRYREEAENRLKTHLESPEILTDQDIRHLPDLIQKYLHFTGSIGKPVIWNFHAVLSGTMKMKANSAWSKISAQQYNFFNEPARLFYIRSTLFRIPFEGLHIYSGETATMEIAVASLFKVVDARGEKMDRSETVTLFNDMCLFAPSTLIKSNIIWEQIDSLSVNASFTNGKNKISAKLTFNSDGSLLDFISNDRLYSEDGKTYLSYPWSTPIRYYKEIDGRKVPASAEAVWHMPGKIYSYAKFDVKEVEYNIKDL